MDYREYTKIGIIGPKPVLIGGHDYNNPTRIIVRNKITNLIENLKKQEIKILGFTGLSLGVEQDFAISCYENNIEYIAILPFEKQESGWKEIPYVQKIYQELLERSNHSTLLEKGGYSPKKIINKYKKIIEISDMVICVETKDSRTPEQIQNLLKNKTTVIINV